MEFNDCWGNSISVARKNIDWLYSVLWTLAHSSWPCDISDSVDTDCLWKPFQDLSCPSLLCQVIVTAPSRFFVIIYAECCYCEKLPGDYLRRHRITLSLTVDMMMIHCDDILTWPLLVWMTAGEFISRSPHTSWPSCRRWLFEACSDPWWTETETRCRSGASETVITLLVSLCYIAFHYEQLSCFFAFVCLCHH